MGRILRRLGVVAVVFSLLLPSSIGEAADDSSRATQGASVIYSETALMERLGARFDRVFTGDQTLRRVQQLRPALALASAGPLAEEYIEAIAADDLERVIVLAFVEIPQFETEFYFMEPILKGLKRHSRQGVSTAELLVKIPFIIESQITIFLADHTQMFVDGMAPAVPATPAQLRALEMEVLRWFFLARGTSSAAHPHGRTLVEALMDHVPKGHMNPKSAGYRSFRREIGSIFVELTVLHSAYNRRVLYEGGGLALAVASTPHRLTNNMERLAELAWWFDTYRLEGASDEEWKRLDGDLTELGWELAEMGDHPGRASDMAALVKAYAALNHAIHAWHRQKRSAPLESAA